MVYLICNYDEHYTFCNLIKRMFDKVSISPLIVKAKIGYRWITIETIPYDILRVVKIPVMARTDLEKALEIIVSLVEHIANVKTRPTPKTPKHELVKMINEIFGDEQ